MGLLINQLLDLQSDKELKYIYVFKIELTKGKKTKIIYSVCYCSDEPLIKLQEMLYSFYQTNGYSPRAKILKAEQCSDYEHITKLLQYELLDNRFHFQGLSNIYSINEKELLSLYHTHIPNRDGVTMHEMMPRWSLSDAEYQELVDNSLDVTNDYYAVKVP